MSSIGEKISKNLKEGSLIKNGSAALRNRFLKWLKHANMFYFLDEERVLTKKYCKDLNQSYDNLKAMGNYFLDKRVPLDEKSVVYSLGILRHITFDTQVAKTHNCNVFMFDPSPVSADFMKEQGNPNFQFENIAIWTEKTVLKFYEPKLGGSPSAVFQFSDKYFEAEAHTMMDVMARKGHKHIDVFKADIEGAALPIVEQMIEEKILPDQIVVEFERPRDDMPAVEHFFERITTMRNKLESLNYEVRLLPRSLGKYFSLEFLFVKKSKITS